MKEFLTGLIICFCLASCSDRPSAVSETVDMVDSLQFPIATEIDSVTKINQVDEFGRKQGVWEKYYKNGSIESQAFYINDTLSGTHKSYYEDGNIMGIVQFKNGLHHGEYKIFSPEGTLKIYAKMNMGERVQFNKYNSSGSLEVEEIYKDGEFYQSIIHWKGHKDSSIVE